MITREFIENATPDELIPLSAEITNDYLQALAFIERLIDAGNLVDDGYQVLWVDKYPNSEPPDSSIEWQGLINNWRSQ